MGLISRVSSRTYRCVLFTFMLPDDFIASIASVISTRAVTQPIDFVKIRLQCDTRKPNSSNLTNFIKNIYKNEFKIRGFFKGHLTGQLLYLGWSIEYPLFNYINKNYFKGKSAVSRLKSGLLTGFICVLLLNPLDTLRTNLV